MPRYDLYLATAGLTCWMNPKLFWQLSFPRKSNWLKWFPLVQSLTVAHQMSKPPIRGKNRTVMQFRSFSTSSHSVFGRSSLKCSTHRFEWSSNCAKPIDSKWVRSVFPQWSTFLPGSIFSHFRPRWTFNLAGAVFLLQIAPGKKHDPCSRLRPGPVVEVGKWQRTATLAKN